MIFFQLLFSAGKLWFQKEADQYAAALAYFVPFALTPLLLISVTWVGLLVGVDRLILFLSNWGATIDPELPNIMTNALVQLETRSDEFTIPLLAVLFFSLMILVALNSLTAGIHKLWGVNRSGFKFFLSRYSRAILGIILIQFYFVSLIIISGFVTWAQVIIPTTVELIIQLAGFLFTTVVFLAFAYKLLPVATLPFKACFYGGLVAGFLFLGVRTFVNVHLITAPSVTLYGAASIVIILLIWFYAVGSIILFGASFAKVYNDSQN